VVFPARWGGILPAEAADAARSLQAAEAVASAALLRRTARHLRRLSCPAAASSFRGAPDAFRTFHLPDVRRGVDRRGGRYRRGGGTC
jgi:hypothetical protein